MTVNFTAYGVPAPQGSTRAFVVAGRAVTTSANKLTRPWRDTVSAAARDVMQEHDLFDGPVQVSATFVMPRPKSRPKRDRWPDRKPDVDKLARALLDALSGPVFRDDAQVVTLNVTKRYVGDPLAPADLHEPGVAVLVDCAGGYPEAAA